MSEKDQQEKPRRVQSLPETETNLTNVKQELIDVKPDVTSAIAKPMKMKPEMTILEAALMDMRSNNVAGSSSQSSSSPTNEITEDESEASEDKKSAKIIEVKCGPLTAKMHVEFFVCPGIHQCCIKLDGEDELITPKAFTIRANKDKQKDWKGSIRIGKSNLRTLMEMRSFDFYNHANFCSAKCQSRNYITPKERDYYDLEGRRLSLTSKPPPIVYNSAQNNVIYNPRLEPKTASTLGALFKNPSFNHMVQMSQVLRNNNSFSSSNEGGGTTSPSVTVASQPLPPPPVFKNGVVKEELVDVDDTLSGESSPPATSVTASTVPNPDAVEHITAQMTNDPSVFWHEMTQSGLADNIIDQMIGALNNMREKLKHGNISNVAPFLSRSIASLGICDKVVSTIRRRNSVTTNNTHRLSTDYSSVEDPLVRKRSIDEIFEQHLLMKRPKLQYPVKTTTSAIMNELSSQPVKTEPPVDKNFISALFQMQNMTNQSPSEMLMQLASSINPPNGSAASVLSHMSDSLLAIK